MNPQNNPINEIQKTSDKQKSYNLQNRYTNAQVQCKENKEDWVLTSTEPFLAIFVQSLAATPDFQSKSMVIVVEGLWSAEKKQVM